MADNRNVNAITAPAPILGNGIAQFIASQPLSQVRVARNTRQGGAKAVGFYNDQLTDEPPAAAAPETAAPPIAPSIGKFVADSGGSGVASGQGGAPVSAALGGPGMNGQGRGITPPASFNPASEFGVPTSPGASNSIGLNGPGMASNGRGITAPAGFTDLGVPSSGPSGALNGQGMEGTGRGISAPSGFTDLGVASSGPSGSLAGPGMGGTGSGISAPGGFMDSGTFGDGNGADRGTAVDGPGMGGTGGGVSTGAGSSGTSGAGMAGTGGGISLGSTGASGISLGGTSSGVTSGPSEGGTSASAGGAPAGGEAGPSAGEASGFDAGGYAGADYGGADAGGGFDGGGGGGGADGGGGGCWLSEAVAAAGGMGDNGMELQTLRQFRDTVMMSNPVGQSLAQQYDMIAPIVVEGISARPDAMQIYQQIKGEFIDPAVEAIQAGHTEEALKIYAQMVSFVTPFAIEVIAGPGGQPTDSPFGDDQEAMDDLDTNAVLLQHSPEMATTATGDQQYPTAFEQEGSVTGADAMGSMFAGQQQPQQPSQQPPQMPAQMRRY